MDAIGNIRNLVIVCNTNGHKLPGFPYLFFGVPKTLISLSTSKSTTYFLGGFPFDSNSNCNRLCGTYNAHKSSECSSARLPVPTGGRLLLLSWQSPDVDAPLAPLPAERRGGGVRADPPQHPESLDVPSGQAGGVGLHEVPLIVVPSPDSDQTLRRKSFCPLLS